MKHVVTALATTLATTRATVVASLLLGGALSLPTMAEDKLIDAEQCVRLTAIDRTRVVDRQNILFYMKNGDIYRNRLPRECPGLAFEDTFMYRTSLNQLCNVDIITVLRNMGFGFQPGISCGLGMFEPIDELTAEELLRTEE